MARSSSRTPTIRRSRGSMDELHPFVLKRILALRQFRVLAAAELRELATLAENVSEVRFARGEVFARREPAMTAIATRPTHTLQLLASDVTDLLEENYSVLRATLQDLAAR